MSNLFPLILLGHLVGDYLFQNNWMALNKKDKLLPAFVHAGVYSLCIGAFLLFCDASWAAWLLYVTLNGFFHLIIDAEGPLEYWLHAIGGRSWKRAIQYLNEDHSEIEKQAMVSYTALVQTVADNTVHLFCLTLTLPILGT